VPAFLTITLAAVYENAPVSPPKQFLQHGGVAGIGKLKIQVIADEVEKGFEVGIAGVLG
jgi:hypothetical protein